MHDGGPVSRESHDDAFVYPHLERAQYLAARQRPELALAGFADAARVIHVSVIARDLSCGGECVAIQTYALLASDGELLDETTFAVATICDDVVPPLVALACGVDAKVSVRCDAMARV
jgi:hypothetical protein